MEKTLSYWKENGEEDYKTTPISVLKYISELESTKNDLVINLVACKTAFIIEGYDKKALTEIDESIKKATL